MCGAFGPLMTKSLKGPSPRKISQVSDAEPSSLDTGAGWGSSEDARLALQSRLVFAALLLVIAE